MMRVWRGLVPVAAMGLLTLAGVAWADEEKVPLDKVPAPVMKAVKAKFPGAEIKQAEKEVEDGTTFYEIGLTYQGTNYDVTAKANGTITEIEKTIKVADLPKPVKAALDKKYPGAEIESAEEITKGDAKTYEVIVETKAKKTFEVVLDPSGKILEEEEKKDGDKD